ncbi:MAG: family 3 adenylate cyclase [Rhodocyclaceae bacterium]|nr:family 3 adenylate cyclase [Rhodocyclaceae bacterium]
MDGVQGKLAVLFADVSGSARLYERLGDAEAERAVDRCVKRIERAVEGFGGRLVATGGDEIMATFETAETACLAALEMQQRVADLPPVSGVKLAIRIGFHVGPVTEGDAGPIGETVKTAAHIVGFATSGRILASQDAIAELPAHLREGVRDPGLAAGKGGEVPMLEVVWQRAEETIPPAAKPPVEKTPAKPAAQAAAAAEKSSTKLCLRYHGRAYLLDNKTPILSLGRDSSSDVVIEDRKASRHHARIEKRGDQFVYVDRSTNGSYVTLAAAKETMIRRTEIVLLGAGSVCFGASANDPAADGATFEYL